MPEGYPGGKVKQDETDSTITRDQAEPEVENQDMPLLAVVASDDEDETTARRSEGGQSSWSATSEEDRATGKIVLVQSRVTYLRERRHGEEPSDG